MQNLKRWTLRLLSLALVLVLLAPCAVFAAESEQTIGVYAVTETVVVGEYTAPFEDGAATITLDGGVSIRVSDVSAARLIVTPIPTTETEAWTWITDCFREFTLPTHAFEICIADENGLRSTPNGASVTIECAERAPNACSLTPLGRVQVLEQSVREGAVTFTANDAPYYVLTGELRCLTERFTDCPYRWYHEPIDFVLANRLMFGVSSTEFAPEDGMTRGMMISVLYRAAGSPEVAGPSSFVDVSENRYYSDAIAWAQECGIVKGITETEFAPDAPVSREQVASILWRYAGRPAAEGDLSSFTDAAQISNYAREAMCWAAETGLFVGSGGQLRPTQDITRAEFASVMMRWLSGSFHCPKLNLE